MKRIAFFLLVICFPLSAFSQASIFYHDSSMWILEREIMSKLKTPPTIQDINESDYRSIMSFLEIKDEKGVTNGEKLQRYLLIDDEEVSDYHYSLEKYTDSDYRRDWEFWSNMEWEKGKDGKYSIVYILWDIVGPGSDEEPFDFRGCLNLAGCQQLKELRILPDQMHMTYPAHEFTVDVSNNPNLEKLTCCGCVSRLRLPKGDKLHFLYCVANLVTELDLRGCTGLYGVDCSDCKNLSSIQLPQEKGNHLIHLNCRGAAVKNLDISNNPEFSVLACADCTALQKITMDKETFKQIVFYFGPEDTDKPHNPSPGENLEPFDNSETWFQSSQQVSLFSTIRPKLYRVSKLPARITKISKNQTILMDSP